MSTYTTEVRYICEFEAGLLENAGYNDVDEVVNNSWQKIFKDFPIFDESYREPLCKKILMHYYTREICAETVGMWKFWLNQKMYEIMPYYNKLYLSEQLKFDPLHEINFTREISESVLNDTSGNSTTTEKNTSAMTANGSTESRAGTTENATERLEANESSTNNASGTQHNGGNTTVNTSSDGQELHSDTPQGDIQNLADGKYLTDAKMLTNTTNSTTTLDTTTSTSSEGTEKSTHNKNTTNSQTSENTSKSQHSRTESNEESNQNVNEYSENNNNVRKYTEHITGKNSTASYAKLIEDYRNSFLNIDLQVILELKELFFNLY